MGEEIKRLASGYLQTLRSKPAKIVSSEEALKDVTPIDWDNDVIDGKRKIVVTLDAEHETKDGVPWIAE